MNRLPLLCSYGPDDVLAWDGEGSITCRRFSGRVAALANTLPDKPHVINLCQNRYLFLVGFAAALTRGQVTLLPPGRAPEVLRQLNRDYQGYQLIDKDVLAAIGHEPPYAGPNGGADCPMAEVPSFRHNQPAVIAFTSGSTGRPRPNPKTWGSLVEIAGKTGRCLGAQSLKAAGVVATVPPQHMYGLETSVMLPVQHGWALHTGRPFFPEDVSAALKLWPGPRLLITTPVHLRACVAESAPNSGVDMVVSATAPLSSSLAERAERTFGAKVMEVYGFAEAGTIAVRRTMSEKCWRLLDGMSLETVAEGCVVRASYLPAPVPVPDVVSLKGPFEFVLHGRGAEFVKVAGHRVSLGDLNRTLSEIDGVSDGVVFMPEEVEGRITRPVALVVAPGRTEQEILSELRARIDPVFLPRPLYLVDSLPRNETGKLPREALFKLVASRTAAPS